MILKKEMISFLDARSLFNKIKINENLKTHSYLKIGGNADYYFEPESIDDLKYIIHFFNNLNIPIFIIGSGSNLIIRDGGFRGLVINLKNLNRIEINNNYITAYAGVKLTKVSSVALNNSLMGLEFACGIPGTVGGAIIMNAGAYGNEIKDVLDELLILRNNELIKLKKDDILFDYRKTSLYSDDIVIYAVFKLEHGNKQEIIDRVKYLQEQRSLKQPLDYPSCGSVFKRPKGYFAGKLIQDCGLQGFRIGDAEVSLKHANFILNKGNATSRDYIAVLEHVRNEVYNKMGILLEEEVKIIGEELKNT